MKKKKTNPSFATVLLIIGAAVLGVYNEVFMGTMLLVAAIGLIAIMAVKASRDTFREEAEEYANERADMMFEDAIRNADIRVKQEMYIVYGKGFQR
jgi:hypothetical protein